MNKVETLHFMQKIRAYYPNFTMEDFKINEWYDRLKPYDLEDAYAKFDQHLKGEKQEYEPKLHYITKYLKTPKEKAQEKVMNDYTVQCQLCGEFMKLSEYNRKHYSKCLSINYLIRIFKSKGKKVEYEELDSLTEDEFKKIYDKYKEIDNDAKKYYTQVSSTKVSNRQQPNNIHR